MTSLIALPYADLHAHDRASLGWRINAAGALEEVAANLPRLDFDPASLVARGVLVEQAATNRLQNPRCEGAVVGVPGTAPTGWGYIGGSAITQRIAAIGVEDGFPYVDVRFVGTETVSGSLQALFCLQGGSAPAASVGQSWIASLRARIVGGSLANLSSQVVGIDEYNGGGYVNGSVASYPLTATALRNNRGVALRTLTGGATNNIVLLWRTLVALSQPIDVTVRFAAPQLVEAQDATSDVFPPVAAIGASTRAADRISRTLNHRFSRTAFTLLARGLFAQAAPAGLTRGVLQLDDGTNANRIRVENTPGGSALQLVVTIGGADVATLPLGNMTPGTPFGVALAFADGDLAAVRNGGTVQAAAVAVPPGLAFMRVGATGFDHANPMNGWYRAHRLLRGRLDNASLITLAA
jgi:hypothetical protein